MSNQSPLKPVDRISRQELSEIHGRTQYTDQDTLPQHHARVPLAISPSVYHILCYAPSSHYLLIQRQRPLVDEIPQPVPRNMANALPIRFTELLQVSHHAAGT